MANFTYKKGQKIFTGKDYQLIGTTNRVSRCGTRNIGNLVPLTYWQNTARLKIMYFRLSQNIPDRDTFREPLCMPLKKF